MYSPRCERELRTVHGDRLRPRAHEPHLDAAFGFVVDGAMLEMLEVEIRAELAVQAREHVEVELGRDAGLSL